MENNDERKSLAVVGFNLGELLKGVQDKKEEEKQQVMDDKVKQLEEDMNQRENV